MQTLRLVYVRIHRYVYVYVYAYAYVRVYVYAYAAQYWLKCFVFVGLPPLLKGTCFPLDDPAIQRVQVLSSVVIDRARTKNRSFAARKIRGNEEICFFFFPPSH